MISNKGIGEANLRFVTLDFDFDCDGERVTGICTIHYWREHLGFLRIEGLVREFDTEAIWLFGRHQA